MLTFAQGRARRKQNQWSFLAEQNWKKNTLNTDPWFVKTSAIFSSAVFIRFPYGILKCEQKKHRSPCCLPGGTDKPTEKLLEVSGIPSIGCPRCSSYTEYLGKMTRMNEEAAVLRDWWAPGWGFWRKQPSVLRTSVLAPTICVLKCFKDILIFYQLPSFCSVSCFVIHSNIPHFLFFVGWNFPKKSSPNSSNRPVNPRTNHHQRIHLAMYIWYIDPTSPYDKSHQIPLFFDGSMNYFLSSSNMALLVLNVGNGRMIHIININTLPSNPHSHSHSPMFHKSNKIQ